MDAFRYIRSRLNRSYDIANLGPNEARILYDITSGYAALFLVFAYNVLFAGIEWEWRLWLLPILLLAVNYLFGIYTRFRMLHGKHKAVILVCSLSIVAVLGIAASNAPSLVCLWAFITAGPLILPRIILALPYGRHKQLIKNVINQKGPVLVVGGAGYIGTHVVDLLLREGRAVRVLDRLMYGKQALADFLGHPHFELIEGDATDIARLTQAMKDVSAVIHLAGLVGDPACAVDQDFTRHTNIISTRMIKDVAQAMGVYRFIFASSCSVYGVSDKEIKEGDPLNPVSLYAETKIDSERELLYSVRDDFFVTILRFATVFGHSRRPRFDLVANLFTAQAMTDGIISIVGPNQWRPFIHVRDLARAVNIVLKTDAPLVQGQIFNVGDKRLNMTIGQLGERVRDIVSRERDVEMRVTENEQDRRNYAVSFDKIRSFLGFEASMLADEGIREMVGHFKQGTYRDYREEVYSNLAMTKEAVGYFQDPMQTSRLYAPLTEQIRKP
jgi:nucleoside-diphosphate-sugar epimerase